jgi:hypothetical protein
MLAGCPADWLAGTWVTDVVWPLLIALIFMV